ncbi:ComF family protein [Caenispirillum bisanense]|uniref:ComF family protein n=1 Tax=Caenispirillum bisanense TaxID=414052 RepID=UPI0031E06F06
MPRLARALLDLLLPPRCLSCGAVVSEPGALCPDCFAAVTFLGPPVCACCGDPFELAMEEGALCAVCIADPPPFARARAAFRYDDGSRDLVLRFKHADRTDCAAPFARWMLRAGRELVRDADLIVPVPLHRLRLLRRRYNQAALLARALDRHGDRPGRYAPDLLLRARRTPPQEGLGRSARRLNMRAAFAVADPARLEGRRVLVVDDVLTTGATVGECARVLLRAGAAAVDVLTLARVVLDPDGAAAETDSPYQAYP